MLTFIKNIKSLLNVRTGQQLLKGPALAEMPAIDHAYLLIEDGLIAGFGSMEDVPATLQQGKHEVIDAAGQIVMPAWCDSHTHLVFAGSREHEFVDKIRGLTYAEIAARGGGILHSAEKLRQTSEDALFGEAWSRLMSVASMGTGAIEIKSGYGLDTASELKMLRVIKRLREKSPLIVKATFLGAHTYPAQYRDDHEAYINSIIHEMLPVIEKEKLADYIDVFCERGFFSPEEMNRIVTAGKSAGLKPKLHVNQLNSIGGLQEAIRLGAVSADHLETMTDNDIRDLASSNTIGTLLPTAAYFLRMPFQPARQIIDAGAAVAIASDYNPGSSPSGNMNLVASMSCIQMKMLPEEALNAGTINGAYAMGAEDVTGSITVGKKANLIITRPVPSLAYIPYSFGSNLIDKVMLNGTVI